MKPRGVAPVGPEREQASQIETGNDPPARAEPNAVAQARSDQAVVGQHEALAQRRADMVDELQRRRAGRSFQPSITMKSGRVPVSSIALQTPMNSQGWPMHSLKPTGLPCDSSRSRA
jgi:hypothetical protein